MKLTDQVLYGVEDASGGRYDAGLLHACITIDTTAQRLFPKFRRVGARYIACLRRYYWLLEPMIGSGVNLVETKFSNVVLSRTARPDLAEIIYEIFRCSHAHGAEIPPQYSINMVTPEWLIAKSELHMPDTVVWALLAVAVLSKVNAGEHSAGEHYLSLCGDKFPVREWWGREDDFRPIADGHNKVRVKLEGLEHCPVFPPGEYLHMAKVKSPT